MRKPEPPEGYTKGAPASLSQVQEGSGIPRSDRFKRGLIWSGIAGVCMSMSVLVGCLVGSYGLTHLEREEKRPKAFVTGFVLMLCLGQAVAVAGGVGFSADVVVGSLVSLVVSRLILKERLQAGNGFAILMGATLITLAVDSWYAWMSGSSIIQVIDAFVDEYLASAEVQAQLGTGAQVSAVREWMGVYWPTAFVMSAALEMLFSSTGTRLALRKMGEVAPRRGLSKYDLPSWVAVLFVVGLAGVLAGGMSPIQPELASLVGENLFLVTRIAFCLQGVGIAMWFGQKHRFGPMVRLLLLVLLAWIEVRFFLVSVLGLVDLAANFRGLSRFDDGGSGANMSSNEPA